MDITESILNKIAHLHKKILDLKSENEKLNGLLSIEKTNNTALREKLEKLSQVPNQELKSVKYKPLILNPELFDDSDNKEVKNRLNQYIKELSSYIKTLERKNKRKK